MILISLFFSHENVIKNTNFAVIFLSSPTTFAVVFVVRSTTFALAKL